jgi:hypothetical protein
MRVNYGVFVVAALSSLAAAGCADSFGGRKEITGTVTLVGQPLDQGIIQFLPVDRATQDCQAGAEIVAGHFSIPAKNGLKPGKYLVQITSGDGKTVANDPEAVPGPGGSANIVSWDRIPPEWNVDSEKQVTVTETGQNQFDFDIPRLNSRKKR